MCNVGDSGYVHPTYVLKDPWGLKFKADNVNAVVPSRLKGMASFSKLVSARGKRIVTRSVLSELVSHLIESQD